MAGRRDSRDGDGAVDRDEQRRREREARERARERRRDRTDEKQLEARAREREESLLRVAAAQRQAEETRAAAARWREAEAVRAAAATPPAEAGPASAPAAVDVLADVDLDLDFEFGGDVTAERVGPAPSGPRPDFAAPLTRAGRERQAVFAPASPAAPRDDDHDGAVPAGRGRRSSGARGRADRGRAAVGPGATRSTRGEVADRALTALQGAAGAFAAGAAGTVAAARERPRHALAALLAVGVVGAGVTVAGGGGGADQADGTKASAKAVAAKKKRAKSPYGTPTEVVLPPKTRVVAYTGAPQADELGILGTMPFEQASDRLERQARPYDRKTRPVLPAFDLIATIADAHPGPAGKYRTRQSSAVIARYLRAARRHDAMLILDVQPGGSNFIDELRPLERWLKEPDVALALDPEWRMRPGVQPGSEIGYVSAGEVTETLKRVAAIVKENDLPPKLVLVHRFTDGMIKDLPSVKVPEGIVGVISIDGVGSRELKIATYDRIAPTLPKPWLAGFKLFYEEDAAAGGMMYGEQVMALKPRPHVVLYE